MAGSARVTPLRNASNAPSMERSEILLKYFTSAEPSFGVTSRSALMPSVILKVATKNSLSQNHMQEHERLDVAGEKSDGNDSPHREQENLTFPRSRSTGNRTGLAPPPTSDAKTV